MEVVDCNKADMRNQYGVFSDFSSMPQGFRPPTVWLLAPHDGSISSFEEAVGGSVTAITMVDAQERDYITSGGSTASLSVDAVGYITGATEGGATCTADVSSSAAISAAMEGGATTTFATTATAPFIVAAQGGAVLVIDFTKIVFISGASLDDGAISVGLISEGVWQHPKGKQTSQNSSLIPALL